MRSLSRVERDYSLVLPAGLTVSEMPKGKMDGYDLASISILLFLLFHVVRVYFLFPPQGSSYPLSPSLPHRCCLCPILPPT